MWVAEGHENKEIADLLCISLKTVEKHRANLMEKFDLHKVDIFWGQVLFLDIPSG